jgi:hypothetical protein
MLRKSKTNTAERQLRRERSLYMKNIRSACDTLVDSMIRAESNIEDKDIRNTFGELREKVEKYNVTETELVSIMLIGENLRTEDAWVATDLEMWCLEVIRELRCKNDKRTDLMNKFNDESSSALSYIFKAYNLTDDDKIEKLLFDAEQDIKDCLYCIDKDTYNTAAYEALHSAFVNVAEAYSISEGDKVEELISDALDAVKHSEFILANLLN